MAETFESLLVRLSRAGVDYLVAGGVAVCLNGYVRTTQDIDLLVDASPANLRRLLDCLAEFGQGFSRELSADDFPLEEGAVRIVEDFTIDVFTLLRSRTYFARTDAANSCDRGSPLLAAGAVAGSTAMSKRPSVCHGSPPPLRPCSSL